MTKINKLNLVTIVILASWFTTAATSGFVLDTLEAALKSYNNSVRQYGWLFFTVSVVASVVSLTYLLIREHRK